MYKWVRAMCVVLAFVLLVGTLSGCSQGTQGEPQGGEPPAPKDTLRVALTSEPPSLTTCDHDSLISVGLNLLTFNSLYKIDHASLLPVPDLAYEYSVENDTEWTFKLKEGVKFHNGDLFTAHDVVATIEYAKTVPGSTLYTGSIKSVEAIDDYTVKITTHKPYAGLLYDLGYHYNFILPKSLIEKGHDFNMEPIGTGPYKLVSWDYGNSLKYEAFEDYFDADHKAKIKNLEFVIIPEGASRAIALEAGEVDFVWEVSGADVARLNANPNVNVLEVDTVDNVTLFMNNDVKPFDDPNVRRAINYAINRQDIIDGALNGYGRVNYSVISQGFWGSTNKNAPEYNLDKAREYLNAWGGDPSTINLPILCSNETRVAIATIIQSNLAQLGIKVEVVPMDTATYFAKWTAGDYVGVIASWSPSNSLTYVQRFHSNRRNAYPGSLNSPEIDALVLQAEGTIDNDARLALIEEIVSEVNLLSPQISLYQSVWLRAHHKDLAGIVCSATGYTAYNDFYWKK
ncbi:MAG TPA: ABC transporter substrate-binding protein [Firmicutes bacterium]|nr:ABC transporter substrate-binding protein [Candidatus Fermentithermobacillaceae bacterium]